MYYVIYCTHLNCFQVACESMSHVGARAMAMSLAFSRLSHKPIEHFRYKACGGGAGEMIVLVTVSIPGCPGQRRELFS
jgi:hypothetical protein